MRRPSPLPAPPPRTHDEPDAVAPRPDDVAPVLAFRPETPDAPSDPAALPPEEGEADRAFGVRDVWRAARARRRALRAEVRRFTVRQRRRRMLWLGAAGAFVLLVAGTVGAAYSPIFAVRDIEVVGTSQLDAVAVEEALGTQLGTPLALVDSSAVKAALVQFPLVESYTLEARPPSGLVVRIVERLPIGYRESGAGFTVLDAAGVALSTTPTPPAGLPALDIAGSTDAAAFRAAGHVMRALPEALRAQVTGVSASTADDVTLRLDATDTTITWGSPERSADKARALDALLVSRGLDTMRTVDVSSPEAVVVG